MPNSSPSALRDSITATRCLGSCFIAFLVISFSSSANGVVYGSTYVPVDQDDHGEHQALTRSGNIDHIAIDHFLPFGHIGGSLHLLDAHNLVALLDESTEEVSASDLGKTAVRFVVLHAWITMQSRSTDRPSSW